MAVAVFGGTGLIGRHVVAQLAVRTPVVATFRSRAPFEAANVRWVQADLRDRNQASSALEECDSAVICAGRVSTSVVLRADPIDSVLETLRIVTNALEACAARGLSQVVLISSCTVYPTVEQLAGEEMALVGNPPGSWFGVGWMHRYLEKQLEWYVVSLKRIAAGIVLRPTLVYGPYDDFRPDTGHFLPTFVRKVVNRERPILLLGNGLQTRNLIHARDLAAAAALALESAGAAFRTFNVATRDEVAVRDILQILIEIDGFEGASVELEKADGGPPSSLKISGASFASATGWNPAVELRDGLTELLGWYRRTLRDDNETARSASQAAPAPAP